MRKLIVLLLCALPLVAQKQPQPRLSHDSLTAEQLAVYRAFLSSYSKGSKRHLNLDDKTVALNLSRADGDCLNGITLENPGDSSSTVHSFRPDDFRGMDVRLVDAEEQQKLIEKNDPQNLIHRAIDEGAKVSETELDQSVTLAFAGGMLKLSEITFDKNHRYAVMTFGFYCGQLCGHGAVLVFHKVRGGWRESKRACTQWVA